MTTYTAEETAANRKIWTDALRSGEFLQGAEALRIPSDAGDTYCCLGVASELCADRGIVERTEAGYSIGSGIETSEAGTLLPPRAVVEWLGLASEHGDLVEHVGYVYDDDAFAPNTYGTALTELNDSGKFTFEDIADVIDAGNIQLAEAA